VVNQKVTIMGQVMVVKQQLVTTKRIIELSTIIKITIEVGGLGGVTAKVTNIIRYKLKETNFVVSLQVKLT
jgi:hypothetical protein